MSDIIFQAGQRVYVLGSAVAGKQWKAPGEPGTIAQVYEGANVSGYYVRLDSDAERMVFCTNEELRVMSSATR